jgi:protein involved in polysaccharide export with SLBB domain
LDVFVEHGDNIYIPKLNSTITIVGNVLNPITVPYNPKFSSKDYIGLAGGFSKTADKRSSYIVFPNGISRKIKNSYFEIRQGSNPLPGSTIIIPRKANNLDTMSFLKFATPILADLSVTAASISAITKD